MAEQEVYMYAGKLIPNGEVIRQTEHSRFEVSHDATVGDDGKMINASGFAGARVATFSRIQ